MVSLHFQAEQLTPVSKAAFQHLAGLPIGRLAHFFIEVMRSRRDIEETWFDAYTQAQKELFSAVEASSRLVENHALVLAFHRVLSGVIGIRHDLKPYVIEILKQKQASSLEREPSDSELFFNELASWLRDCRHKQNRAYAEYVDIQNRELWVRPSDLVNHAARPVLLRLDLKKIYNEFKQHPAFLRNCAHRFKYSKGDLGSTIEEVKKAWAFDLDRMDLDVDLDRFVSW